MCTHLNGTVGVDSVIIALAFDSEYAMSAAVTLRSVAENVQGPVTLYILDAGLHNEDKKKIEESLLERRDMTLLYMDLPPNSLSLNVGLHWAKVDVMKCLPAERVIYLDADTLVRKDLRELWKTDLGGHSIAAAPDIAPDIWCPVGDQYIPQTFFNSGVLLLDLVKVRTTLPKLEALCYEMRDAPYGDRDPLSVHFGGDWVLLNLAWNAQGIGSMAKWPDPNRQKQKLPLEQLDDPAIIHFSGPLHPAMIDVLVPDLQPFVAKPWGYAGAPGHPYAKDWWDMLEKTAWKGWRETTEYKEMCEQTRMRMLRAGLEAFKKRLEVMEGIHC